MQKIEPLVQPSVQEAQKFSDGPGTKALRNHHQAPHHRKHLPTGLALNAKGTSNGSGPGTLKNPIQQEESLLQTHEAKHKAWQQIKKISNTLSRMQSRTSGIMGSSTPNTKKYRPIQSCAWPQWSCIWPGPQTGSRKGQTTLNPGTLLYKATPASIRC